MISQGCPLCGGTHDTCEFTAGSLYCVKTDCRNPHHRAPGSPAAEIIAQRQP
jgi:hypothetical protein